MGRHRHNDGGPTSTKTLARKDVMHYLGIPSAWGILAAPPIVTDIDGAVVTKLRLIHASTRAMNAGIPELDATRIIDVTVTGAVPAVTLDVLAVGDRVGIHDGEWSTPRPGSRALRVTASPDAIDCAVFQ